MDSGKCRKDCEDLRFGSMTANGSDSGYWIFEEADEPRDHRISTKNTWTWRERAICPGHIKRVAECTT